MMLANMSVMVRTVILLLSFAGSLLNGIVSDTIPLSSDPEKDKSKITVLTMTDMFASIINKVYNYEEISSSFIN